MEKACKTCKFYFKGVGRNPECRRDPPQVILVKVIEQQTPIGIQALPITNSAFPPVDPNVWCWRYEQAIPEEVGFRMLESMPAMEKN